MFNSQKVVRGKLVQYLPSSLILMTIVAVYFPGPWFYVASVVSAAVILFLFSRALLASPVGGRTGDQPPASRVLLILPLMFLIGMFGTVSASPLAGTFFAILGSNLMYYYYRFFPKNIPLFVEQTTTLFTAFLFAVFLWSLNYFFTPPWWIIVSLTSLGFYVLFWQAYYKICGPQKAALGAAVGMLIMAEISWAMLFWPVHFFTLGAMSLAVFYLVYLLSDLYFNERLSRRKIYFQVSLISVVVLITLLSSSWQPINRL